MDIVKVTHSLKIEGEDAIKFIESLISVDPLEKQLKTSFLLKGAIRIGWALMMDFGHCPQHSTDWFGKTGPR